MKSIGTIYKITNTINNKIYIGQTIKSVKQRWAKHLNTAKNNNSPKAIHKAIQKYGKENFVIEEVCLVFEKEYLNELEIFFIQKFNTKAPFGYNLTNGGNTSFGYKMSKESIEKTRKHNIGRKASLETRQKQSECKKGRKFTKEHKEKLSKARRGYKFNDNFKIKLSDNRLRKALNLDKNIKYKILQLDNSMKIINEYNNLLEVKRNGFNGSYILKTLRGLYGSANGFKWKIEIQKEGDQCHV